MGEPVRAPIVCREQFGELLNKLGLLRVAVEIGTDKGVFAAQLLERWQGRLLICVDPWEDLPEYGGPLSRRPRLPDLLLCCNLLAKFLTGNRVQLLQMTSERAARHEEVQQVLGLIDFVYLDGNHAAEFVRADIATWWPMLAAGGILGGHDWDMPDVQTAVTEFAEANVLKIQVMPGDAWSWYVEKPRPDVPA